MSSFIDNIENDSEILYQSITFLNRYLILYNIAYEAHVALETERL